MEKNLNGLGFKVDNPGVKKISSFKIDMISKSTNLLLMLSYYSMQLSPVFLIEGCISLCYQNFFKKNKADMVGTPVPMKQLINNVRFFASLLRNEHMHNYDDLPEETILEAMEFYI